MLFLIGFSWHVAASFAFLLSILSPNWYTVQFNTTAGNVTVQRGIFYQCDLITQNTTYLATACTSILNLNSNISAPSRWSYNLATSSASLAIAGAGLSIIVLWLAGIYFNVRTKTSCTSCVLLSISLLVLLTLSTSVAVWILLIAEAVVLNYTINRTIFNWPMWLAVGASGGFLMAFFTWLFSFCAVVCCRRRKRNRDTYRAQTQF